MKHHALKTQALDHPVDLDPQTFAAIRGIVLREAKTAKYVSLRAAFDEARRSLKTPVNGNHQAAVRDALIAERPELAAKLRTRDRGRPVMSHDDPITPEPEHVVLAELARRGLRITTIEVATRSGEVKRASWQRLIEIAEAKAARKAGAK